MKITLIAAISADGKIAQNAKQSSLDWTSKEDTRFFADKTKDIGAVVMGRKTFETIGRPLKDRRTIVMSSTGGSETEKFEGRDGVEWTRETPAELVARLSKKGLTGLAVCGGSTIYSQFLEAGLVNELFLTVEPVLFGDGVPLASGFGRIDLKLVESKPMGGGILLHFLTQSKK